MLIFGLQGYLGAFLRRDGYALRTVDSGMAINAEISAERFAELGLKSGDMVHVSPRRVRVFAQDYSI